MISRRQTIAGITTLAAWPLAARAQQAVPVIGFVGSGLREGFEPMVTAFREGLRESGYSEGRNVAIEFRWAEGRYERLPSLMAEMVARPVAVLVAGGGIVSAQAAKEATSTIPVVFATGADPVTGNVVSSLSHPGGNVTGVFMLTVTLATKRLELLRELVPAATSFAMLTNPNNPNTPHEINELRAVAKAMGLDIQVEPAGRDGGFDAAFDAFAARRAKALIVATDTYFNTQRARIVELAARHLLPAAYSWSEFARAGGLISYGSNREQEYRRVGVLTGKILRGAKPGDLPVEQASTVELAINLKTAKALGLTIPLPLLGRADEVIE